MNKAILDKNNIATQAGNITVYNYDSITREYTSSAVEYIAVGVGIPANSTIDNPLEEKEGMAVCCKTGRGWEYVADHRGETVYSTENGEAIEITTPGDYPVGTTTIAAATPYDRWDGKKWVTDREAEHAADIEVAEQKKTSLVSAANTTIAPLQDAVDLDIATEEEAQLLLAWKKYRVLLNRVDTSAAHYIEWPTQPGY